VGSNRITSVAVVALDVALLRVGWVSPSELMAHLAHPRLWVDTMGTDGAALELARTGLWLAALWLGLAVIAVLASALPGALGRSADGLAARVVPAVLRRTIGAAVGASIVLVPIAAGASPSAGTGGARSGGAAVVAPATTRPAAPSVSPNASQRSPTNLSGGWPWPTSAPPARTSVSTSAAPAPPVPWPRSATPTGPAHRHSAAEVVVGAGDCLWAIAAHRLGPQAGQHRIASETRRWYEANAATIGADPDVIHPGQHLYAPIQKGR
jgi:resuscitation-promoting factor RpfA